MAISFIRVSQVTATAVVQRTVLPFLKLLIAFLAAISPIAMRTLHFDARN
jgi:hypothetical protein